MHDKPEIVTVAFDLNPDEALHVLHCLVTADEPIGLEQIDIRNAIIDRMHAILSPAMTPVQLQHFGYWRDWNRGNVSNLFATLPEAERNGFHSVATSLGSQFAYAAQPVLDAAAESDDISPAAFQAGIIAAHLDGAAATLSQMVDDTEEGRRQIGRDAGRYVAGVLALLHEAADEAGIHVPDPTEPFFAADDGETRH